ncbi:TonB system biopolymer transport protein ExbD/TolR [Aliivibrio wodanis]|uniref:TonB system biopolymer transport protein ExbD/TolR n=1 Tax=Aliivibrio wodanis TaxID=80852 RepID=A0A090IBA8_9GAMM|nr:TonB system biopolymer transport protein ExbD/TolR [Aliivibrio wodanis]
MKIKPFMSTEESPQVDLTPLIDVVFILLIFFILSANFQKESSIEVDRPSASSSTVKEASKTLTVSVDRNHQIWFKDSVVNLTQLQFEMKSVVLKKEKINTIINADKSVDTGTLVQIIDAIRLTGISNVAIATQEQ